MLTTKPPAYSRIPTGIFTLDLGLAGGWQNSRCSMLYGEKSSGKTTTAMRTAINAQRMYPDMVVAWADIEGTFDEVWFKKLGGDPSRLVLIEPESGEHAVDIIDTLVRTKETSVIVTDSIAMLVPMKEVESSAEDSLVGIHARLVGNFLRRTTNAVLRERHRGHFPLVLHINQFRMKIGIAFGDPRTLPGGKALEFATTQQVEMRNKEHLSEKGDQSEVSFNEHTFKITKDKSGGRVREGKFKLIRSPEHNNGLPEGFIEQTKTMFAAAEIVGLAKGRFEFDGFGKKASFDDWNKFFANDIEASARCQARIIQAYRKKWGLDD
jgi:recombination protein RecA